MDEEEATRKREICRENGGRDRGYSSDAHYTSVVATRNRRE